MFTERTSIGLDVHARSVAAAAIDSLTGEVVQGRLTPVLAGPTTSISMEDLSNVCRFPSTGFSGRSPSVVVRLRRCTSRFPLSSAGPVCGLAGIAAPDCASGLSGWFRLAGASSSSCPCSGGIGSIPSYRVCLSWGQVGVVGEFGCGVGVVERRSSGRRRRTRDRPGRGCVRSGERDRWFHVGYRRVGCRVCGSWRSECPLGLGWVGKGMPELAGGLADPGGVAEQYAAEEDGVGLSECDDVLCLLGFGYQADCCSGDAGFAADTCREGDLVPGSDRDEGVGCGPASGHVDEVDAKALEVCSEGDGVVRGPAVAGVVGVTGEPVGGRDAEE